MSQALFSFDQSNKARTLQFSLACCRHLSLRLLFHLRREVLQTSSNKRAHKQNNLFGIGKDLNKQICAKVRSFFSTQLPLTYPACLRVALRSPAPGVSEGVSKESACQLAVDIEDHHKKGGTRVFNNSDSVLDCFGTLVSNIWTHTIYWAQYLLQLYIWYHSICKWAYKRSPVQNKSSLALWGSMLSFCT